MVRKKNQYTTVLLLMIGMIMFGFMLVGCNGNVDEEEKKAKEDGEFGQPNSTHALVMLESRASGLGVEKISDLSPNNLAGTMVISAEEELYSGEMLLEAMQQVYGIYFKNHAVHMPGEGYSTLVEGSGDANVEAILVKTDDEVLKRDDIRILQDDKNFFITDKEPQKSN
ncbi:hypothetical protein BHU72_05135 [Desulfuribacillus stibiiarsenatis]|uniref:ABC-type glycine betaine transport system substrate-binding domain-containing protein n=1 Tax=Desulfuribacillus stibiiarsenatis TaxID=1390249 RepID=A0A1E5L5S6_9FIRM|nr:glycine betaine ABC transporter substrate-binding protein [Desulfuribacillus stibiiarsenatis]OEH85471.1 hypothetical protein BHU72_05135 [Desulfuribacillus stibiiarsenatis]